MGEGEVAGADGAWERSVRRPLPLRLLDRLGPVFMLVILVLILVVAAALKGDGSLGRILALENARVILVQSVVVATCALGMTMVIVSGGLDLSVGSGVALCSVLGALVIVHTGSLVLGSAAAVATGAAIGCFNGVLISGCRMSPFIITLGSMSIARGLALVVADKRRIYPFASGEVTWMQDMLALDPEGKPWCWIGVGSGVVLCAVLAGAMMLVMRRSVFGRYVYAIGANEDAARLCGIRVAVWKFLIYLGAGCLFGLAGMLLIGRNNGGDPTIGVGLELKVIAAVILGGASLSGGAGTVTGTLVGALIMTCLANGLTHLGADDPWQKVFTGAVLIVATGFDLMRRRGWGVFARLGHGRHGP